jgi:hypothetical protein
MSPAILFAVASKNSADIEAIITAVGGISNALKLLPHLYAIAETVQAEQAQPQPDETTTHPGTATA